MIGDSNMAEKFESHRKAWLSSILPVSKPHPTHPSFFQISRHLKVPNKGQLSHAANMRGYGMGPKKGGHNFATTRISPQTFPLLDFSQI
jgi:hypothetical protein